MVYEKTNLNYVAFVDAVHKQCTFAVNFIYAFPFNLTYAFTISTGIREILMVVVYLLNLAGELMYQIRRAKAPR